MMFGSLPFRNHEDAPKLAKPALRPLPAFQDRSCRTPDSGAVSGHGGFQYRRDSGTQRLVSSVQSESVHAGVYILVIISKGQRCHLFSFRMMGDTLR